jgi:hypothetical protein
VKYDSLDRNKFVAVRTNKEVVFKHSESGIYYHTTTNRAVIMVNTVKENREGYTHREFTVAKEAR